MQALASKVVDGHARNAPLLPAGHRSGSPAELLRHPRFDFDEHNRDAILRDDVDFAEPRSVAAFNNCVPAPLQFGAGEIFTGNSKGLTRIVWHAARTYKVRAAHSPQWAG